MLVSSKDKSKNTQDLVTASIQALVEALESGHSNAVMAYLKAMARFHHYSFGNVVLIATQRPDASHVAGIRTWNELGRRVKRGEHGIMIFAPMHGRKRSDEGPDTKVNSSENAVKTDTQVVGFRAVYVFDVAQTEGVSLPELEPQTVKGDVGDKLSKLTAFTTDRGIKLEYTDEIAPAQGISYGGFIKLLPGMEPAEEFSTLVHELAHEMLHKRERRFLTTKTVRETEAEAIAFVVCDALGLEAGDSSRDYIHLYHGNAALLQESLEVVQTTAAVILGAISPQDARTEKAVQQ